MLREAYELTLPPEAEQIRLRERPVGAHASALDTEQGRTGLDVELFRKLAFGNEVRVRQAAESLKDRLRQIVALCAIYQGRATELVKRAKK